jgi:two-component system phosphate regulon sensor histidine kinase PhoR
MPTNLSPKKALILFIFMVVFVFAQAVWWVVLMARLVDEKTELAMELGASEARTEQIHREEISRQIMVGLEGVVFLAVFLLGFWLIYRSLVKSEELKFQQVNFLMAVTHELKTPLASISVYLDTLQSEKISADKKAAVVPRMRQDLVRLEKLVENVLEASRFERSGHSLRHEEFNVSELVEDRLNALETLPSRRPLDVNRQIEDGIHMVGDERAFGRALDYILENCLKYNHSERIIVDVKLLAQNREFILTIRDNGVGMAKKDQAAVFERFYRVGSELTRDAEGTGLGLYLSREIVNAHGGGIVAHSDGPGKGTRFVITCPRSRTL